VEQKIREVRMLKYYLFFSVILFAQKTRGDVKVIPEFLEAEFHVHSKAYSGDDYATGWHGDVTIRALNPGSMQAKLDILCITNHTDREPRDIKEDPENEIFSKKLQRILGIEIRGGKSNYTSGYKKLWGGHIERIIYSIFNIELSIENGVEGINWDVMASFKPVGTYKFTVYPGIGMRWRRNYQGICGLLGGELFINCNISLIGVVKGICH
jgi:hypothetical protein